MASALETIERAAHHARQGARKHIMFSKSAARAFFLLGTLGFSVVFLCLTLDTIRRVPAQTKQQNLTAQVVHGKHLMSSGETLHS
jgi:hypothetical protein